MTYHARAAGVGLIDAVGFDKFLLLIVVEMKTVVGLMAVSG